MTKPTAYYNEFDPQIAAWLRELIKAGLIADGIVDERSIVDVEPSDLKGFTQYHFFAGVGGWSRALRIAGWEDSRPVWTGSPPCQPYSVAGNMKGFEDERHLWPHFFNLIKECKPNNLFFEQVEAAINFGWLDGVQSDLEAENYAIGSVCVPANIGAPHIRQRLWIVGERVSDSASDGHVTTDGLREEIEPSKQEGQVSIGKSKGSGDVNEYATNSYLNFWKNHDLRACKDGKWRPVQPSSVEMVDGLPDRLGLSCATCEDRKEVVCEICSRHPFLMLPVVGESNKRQVIFNPMSEDIANRNMRLKGYGNAIVPQVAAEIIRAYMRKDEPLEGIIPVMAHRQVDMFE